MLMGTCGAGNFDVGRRPRVGSFRDEASAMGAIYARCRRRRNRVERADVRRGVDQPRTCPARSQRHHCTSDRNARNPRLGHHHWLALLPQPIIALGAEVVALTVLLLVATTRSQILHHRNNCDAPRNWLLTRSISTLSCCIPSLAGGIGLLADKPKRRLRRRSRSPARYIWKRPQRLGPAHRNRPLTTAGLDYSRTALDSITLVHVSDPPDVPLSAASKARGSVGPSRCPGSRPSEEDKVPVPELWVSGSRRW